MKEDPSEGQLRLVVLGHHRKNALFDAFCRAAVQWETHAAYADTHYLTLDHRRRNVVVEVSDPGLAKTGGREMAIRAADMGVILLSEWRSSSLEALSDLPSLFALRTKACPIRLVVDTSEDVDGASMESVSEGYESDAEREGMVRRPSMEKMRRKIDDKIDYALVEELGRQLGPLCRVLRVAVNELHDPAIILGELLDEATRKGGKSNTKKKFLGRGSSGEGRSTPDKEVDGEDRKKQSKVCSLM